MPLTVGSGNPTGAVEDFQDSAVKIGNPQIWNTPAPASYAAGAARTLLAADVLNGIIVFGGNANSASTVTLPTAALLAAAMRGFSSRGVAVGDTLEVLLINGAATGATGVVTVAPGSGGTLDPNQSTATLTTGISKVLYIRFTNGAPGSEAYVVYS